VIPLQNLSPTGFPSRVSEVSQEEDVLSSNCTSRRQERSPAQNGAPLRPGATYTKCANRKAHYGSYGADLNCRQCAQLGEPGWTPEEEEAPYSTWAELSPDISSAPAVSDGNYCIDAFHSVLMLFGEITLEETSFKVRAL